METKLHKNNKTSSISISKYQINHFNRKLKHWYERNRRDLPWRSRKDAYAIWISEIILQQTRVEQGIPYYIRFLSEFPDIHTLAEADERKILRAWQGLGYYSRARNIHKTAIRLTRENQGEFPDNYDELIRLPGIGPYTAAAIASIAFNQPTPVLDGNVYRVLARLFGIRFDLKSYSGKKVFHKIALSLIPKSGAGNHNQAMMELGALICKPVNPDCPACPVKKNCYAFSFQVQSGFPVKSKLKKIRHRYFTYYVFQYEKLLYMYRRWQKDIWEGLYEFYLHERTGTRSPVITGIPDLDRIIESKKRSKPVSQYQHQLSHQQIHSKFFIIPINKSQFKMIKSLPGGDFFSLNQIDSLPKPVLISNFLKDTIF